jgi:UDP-2,4-diacetamido-2,4,6-trideoxy-beta-L-altropyranose hydrolase
MKQLLFRVNASTNIGLGHLMRCLALAQGAQINGLSPVFIVNSDAVKNSDRQDWVGQMLTIPECHSPSQELDFIAEFCQTHDIVGIVIDGYHFNQDYRQRLAELDYPVICFDDMNNAGNLFADLIINGAANADKLEYHLNQPDAHLCLGERYRILRQEFLDMELIPVLERPYLSVIMGGSDPWNLTLPILQLFEKKGFDGKLQVITGADYPFLDKLQQFLQATNLDVKHVHDTQQIATCFLQTRFAISAAGGSQFELQATGTPSCLLTVADNQLGATKAAADLGWCITQDFTNIISAQDRQGQIERVLQRALDLWSTPQQLQEMHRQALITVNTKGTQLVVEQIKELCLDD